MKKLRIRKIDVLSAGKVVGLVYVILGLFLGLVNLVSPILTASPRMMDIGYRAGMATGMMYGVEAVILVPIVYGITGFVGGIIFALLYNLIADWIGGIEVETN